MAQGDESKREARRSEILEKAQALFARKGYKKTSMAEIAEATDLAVGSLYCFFDGKEEILATIFEYHIERVIEAARQIRENPDLGVREKINAILEALVHIYVDNQDFFRIYIAEARGVEWGVRTEVGEYIYGGTVRFQKALADVFREAIEAGVVDSGLDPDFLALLLRSFIHSTVSFYLYTERGVTVEELLTTAKRVLFEGVAPETARLLEGTLPEVAET